jgi:uncharacterized membrane protein YjdF
MVVNENFVIFMVGMKYLFYSLLQFFYLEMVNIQLNKWLSMKRTSTPHLARECNGLTASPALILLLLPTCNHKISQFIKCANPSPGNGGHKEEES